MPSDRPYDEDPRGKNEAMAFELKQELEALVGVLGEAAVPYAICGGIAVTIHGAPRLTDDLDLLVPAASVDAAKQAAARIGFDIPAAPMIFGRGTAFARTVHRVSKLDDGELLTLDLIAADGALEAVWRERIVVEWEGHRVPVVSLTGLLAMKRMAGRPKDLLDIAALEGSDENEP
jgi:hypothetical protein